MKPKDIQSYAILLLKWLLLVLAAISGYLSYRGALTVNDNVTIAVCYAVGVGTVLYILATLCLTILPALSSHNRQGSAWAAYFLAIAIAMSMSSYTNLAGILGPTVQEFDAKHLVKSVEAVFSQTSLAAQSAQNTVTSLLAEQTRFLTLAKKEESSGTLSGAKGAGVVTGVYIQAAGIVDAAAKALASKKDDLAELINAANEQLEKMRAVLDEDKDIKIKTLELSSLNRELQSSYEALAATNLRKVIENALGSLDSIIAVPTSKNPALRKTQKEVIKRVRADLAQTKQRYTAENQAGGTDIPEYPVWEPRFQTRLLLAYADQIIPYIVSAIAIDIGAFVVVLLLISLQKEIRDSETENLAEGRKFTVRELNELQAFLKSLKSKDDEDDVL